MVGGEGVGRTGGNVNTFISKIKERPNDRVKTNTSSVGRKLGEGKQSRR